MSLELARGVLLALADQLEAIRAYLRQLGYEVAPFDLATYQREHTTEVISPSPFNAWICAALKAPAGTVFISGNSTMNRAGTRAICDRIDSWRKANP